MFRLRQLSDLEKGPTTPQPSAFRVLDVPVEQQFTEKAFVQPDASPYEVVRKEQTLVLSYKAYMRKRGSVLRRHQIYPKGESYPLFSDLHDPQRKNLLEAKGSASRAHIRMGIGQLADYGRFIATDYAKALLLPQRPKPDLEALLSSQGVSVVWPTESNGFEDNAAGRFTK